MTEGKLQKRIREVMNKSNQINELVVIPDSFIEVVEEAKQDFPFNLDADGMLIAKQYIVEREGYENAPYSNEYEELGKWFVKWFLGGVEENTT